MTKNASISFAPMPFKWALLAGLYCLGICIGGADIMDAVDRERGSETFYRSTILSVHAMMAVPFLLLAPLQFSRRLRARWPVAHRWLGRTFIAGSSIAALGAIYLGLTYKGIGSRTPLFLFGILWLAFTVAAWLCARRRAFAAHERFVVRVYAIALAFVFVRVIGELQDVLFPFMQDQALRDATGEWLSFVVPLICVEAWYTRWPGVRGALTVRTPPI
jgi:uncharacterized membrane protein